ncbi:MAG: hypothetical protein QOF78_1415 [Phycisphaerales bacterium]|jgi:type II secretory pathway pseudopilin PulG|nr:hypothetical protein [Phycisphaerales bacterium]
MKNLLRKVLLAVAALLAVVIVLSVVGVVMFKGTPAWYGDVAGQRPTDAQREQLARAAENKMIDAQNWAATLRADAQRAERNANDPAHRVASTAPRAQASHVIEFSDQELNALFDKWSTLHGWRDKYAEYLEDPRIVLQDDRLILAGRLRELGAVASFQFRPQLDAQGKLRLDVVRVTGGRLPLPEGMWVKWREQLVQSSRRHMPVWRAQAQIDASGAANFPAMAATLSRLLFAVAGKQAAEPVLFLPIAGERDSVPVKVVNVAVETGKLTLVVEPLTPAERVALLQRIRTAQGNDNAQASGY